jgi:hypothetical protein
MLNLSKIILIAVFSFASQSFGQWDRGGCDDRRHGPDRYEQACFYEHANYTGRSFCLSPGQRYRNLDGFFNDMISSIAIDGRLRVSVFSDAGFSGRALAVDRDISNLSNLFGWNDRVSSIIVDYDRGCGRPGPGPGPRPPRR